MAAINREIARRRLAAEDAQRGPVGHFVKNFADGTVQLASGIPLVGGLVDVDELVRRIMTGSPGRPASGFLLTPGDRRAAAALRGLIHMLQRLDGEIPLNLQKLSEGLAFLRSESAERDCRFEPLIISDGELEAIGDLAHPIDPGGDALWILQDQCTPAIPFVQLESRHVRLVQMELDGLQLAWLGSAVSGDIQPDINGETDNKLPVKNKINRTAKAIYRRLQ